MLGYAREELLDQPLGRLVTEQSKQRWRSEVAKCDKPCELDSDARMARARISCSHIVRKQAYTVR